jgi:hypothetical protein
MNIKKIVISTIKQLEEGVREASKGNNNYYLEGDVSFQLEIDGQKVSFTIQGYDSEDETR